MFSVLSDSQLKLSLLIGTTDRGAECGVMLANIFLLILGDIYFIFILQTSYIDHKQIDGNMLIKIIGRQ